MKGIQSPRRGPRRSGDARQAGCSPIRRNGIGHASRRGRENLGDDARRDGHSILLYIHTFIRLMDSRKQKDRQKYNI